MVIDWPFVLAAALILILFAGLAVALGRSAGLLFLAASGRRDDRADENEGEPWGAR